MLRRADPLHLIAVCVLAVVGCPFLGVGLSELNRAREELAGARQVRGTVVGNAYALSQSGDSSSGAYYPEVEFVTVGGRRVRFTDGIGSLPADYEPGAEVEVIYQPERPQQARIRSWKRLWLAPTIFTAVGVLPLALYLLGRALLRWRRRR